MHPVAKRILPPLVPPVGYAYIRMLHRTMNIRYEHREIVDDIQKKGGQYIIAFWHSRFLMMPFGHLSPRLTVMSSSHRDSNMLAEILKRFGVNLSKGSSTRGGVEGLRTIIRKAKRGFDIAFTPDGPKGPRRRIKGGVITTAKLTGLPIIPAAFSAFPATRLGSWDGTLVPKPFSRGVYTYGEPIFIDRRVKGAAEEKIRIGLEETLDRMTDDLDRRTGIGPEKPRAEAG